MMILLIKSLVAYI
jgi:hypothetical protein